MTDATPINTLQFSDEQLVVLNQIVREHKITLSNEELALVAMGKRTSPLISLVVLVASAFEKRQQELQAPPKQPEDSKPAISEPTVKEAQN